jgi:hypothetical protein
MLYNLYSSPNIITMIKSRRIKSVGHAACMGEKKNGYSVSVGKPEEERPLGRPEPRWVYDNKMGLREIGCGIMD